MKILHFDRESIEALLRRTGWDPVGDTGDPASLEWIRAGGVTSGVCALGAKTTEAAFRDECVRIASDRGWNVLHPESPFLEIQCTPCSGESEHGDPPHLGFISLGEVMVSEGILEAGDPA